MTDAVAYLANPCVAGADKGNTAAKKHVKNAAELLKGLIVGDYGWVEILRNNSQYLRTPLRCEAAGCSSSSAYCWRVVLAPDSLSEWLYATESESQQRLEPRFT